MTMLRVRRRSGDASEEVDETNPVPVADRANYIDGYELIGHWSKSHVPAVGVAATITQPAPGPGYKNVVRNLTAILAGGTSAPTAVNVSVSVINGTTATTDFLWRATLSCAATAGVVNGVSPNPLMLVGTDNTATTIEFSAAGGANTFESVTMSGIIVRNRI